MDDKNLRMAMLLDFFGELLTPKQREYLELHYAEDLSLSEIAECAGISRQGVHDIISRAEKSLEAFETKTGVLRRFSELQSDISTAESLAHTLKRFLPDGDANAVFDKLVSTLRNMKG